ncbi:hypothetical protein GIB67_007120, partial [Kingdonia uniflora]
EMREVVIMFFKDIVSVRPLDFTFHFALLACSSILVLMDGCQIHGVVVKSRSNDFFGPSFQRRKLPTRSNDIHFCSNDIHARSNDFNNSSLPLTLMRIFEKMQWETTPNEFTFNTILAACTNIFVLAQGNQIHYYVLKNGNDMDVVINGVLVDMYSKCRYIEYAINIFEEAILMNLILWNSMILGCIHNEKGRGVVELFDLIKEKGIKADHANFQGVLRACISEGFVYLSKHYFESMSVEYCIIPQLENYESMIEFFSRKACMDDLEAFVPNMPFEPTVPVLKRVINAYKKHGHCWKNGSWNALMNVTAQPHFSLRSHHTMKEYNELGR